ncbi:MAG: Response regulator receiver protein [Candidatus Woesebacteria bacterium GW2011_GWD1_38_10]|uniref:Response regulator receiver protein n=3 Tax=Candidatus Woeseibacteriota TaxID=1752722 RepID=A0A0G0NE08_9BACT|nr:MAG: Response regulator receiver protein [Candidatus Woesebacteria bacterium GW2011_GWD1_38_10]KKQ84104.1 MAG: Response regulator receiver protein [Candidatus Woesebacteria bacterium GW2011_GWA1_38_8]
MSNLNNLIMVVEDESLLLEAIGKKLQREGYDVLLCTSAGQAVDYLKNMKENLPDVIWLDYYLTDMNGLEFMDLLGKNENWKRIPVIVVSNSASEQKVAALMKKGVKKHILKADYRLDEIVKIIESYLKKVPVR